jgi:hypothetical protein
MSPDPKPGTPIELEAEREVDFGRYTRRIAARWWLLAIGVALSALAASSSLNDGKNYKATAQVYLGQPLAPDSAAPVSTAPTTLGLVQAFVTSEEAVKQAAAAAGLKPGKLRNNITARPIPARPARQALRAAALDLGHGQFARQTRLQRVSLAAGDQAGRCLRYEDRDA